MGVLTGGGDCPGLNAAIRAIVRRGIDRYGHAIVGFRDGWRGPLEAAFEDLTLESTRGILPRGGTILGTSRTNPFAREGGPDRVRETMRLLDLDGLIAIGGEDTLGAAARFHAEHDLPIVGVPKTIDNDLGGTDMTFGFDTAMQVATEAIDRLHTTAESHNRVMVVEVMGRHAGWIALHSGLAGGADVILIPERPFDIDEVCGLIRRRHARGRYFSIVVVAEGAVPLEGTMEVISAGEDEFGHARLGGIGQRLETEIESRTGYETRATSSATPSVAARPQPSTACSPRGSAWPRWMPPRTGAGARWPRCGGRRSSWCRSPRRWLSCGRSPCPSTSWPRRSSA